MYIQIVLVRQESTKSKFKWKVLRVKLKHENGKILFLGNKYTPLLDSQTIYIKGGVGMNLPKELRKRLNFIQGHFLYFSISICLTIYYKNDILEFHLWPRSLRI